MTFADAIRAKHLRFAVKTRITTTVSVRPKESDRVVVNGVEGREGDVFELTEQGTDVLPPDRDDSPEPENDVVVEPAPKPEPEGD